MMFLRGEEKKENDIASGSLALEGQRRANNPHILLFAVRSARRAAVRCALTCAGAWEPRPARAQWAWSSGREAALTSHSRACSFRRCCFSASCIVQSSFSSHWLWTCLLSEVPRSSLYSGSCSACFAVQSIFLNKILIEGGGASCVLGIALYAGQERGGDCACKMRNTAQGRTSFRTIY